MRLSIENFEETYNCQANIEEKVTLEVIDDLNKHLVTPLSTDDIKAHPWSRGHLGFDFDVRD